MDGEEVNSRKKGKVGELEWKDVLKANGYEARRGQQFSGSKDSPDIVCEALGAFHHEVKRVQALNIEAAMAQARRDAGGKLPLVAHRRNHSEWLVTMPASAFFEILKKGGSWTT
jgi:Holliday junction resolvase